MFLIVCLVVIVTAGIYKIYFWSPYPIHTNQNSINNGTVEDTGHNSEIYSNQTFIDDMNITSIRPENLAESEQKLDHDNATKDSAITSIEYFRMWEEVDDYLYILQNIDLEEIGETEFDLVIVDYSREGDDETRFTRDEIRRLQNSTGGKLVLAYVSIGEAETYRWYWESHWDQDGDGTPNTSAPVWLGPSNPEWPENYKVRYWEQGWKNLIFRYLGMVIDAGFDGVYLDIIDAYEYWSPEGESGLNRSTAKREMIEFVLEIAEYTRQTSNNSEFGVFPQNGEALSIHRDYLEAVTGIGKEDTWYDGNDLQPGNYTEETIIHLDRFRDAGKLVLVIDYPEDPEKIQDFYIKAQSHGYIPYVSNRELDTIKLEDGFIPD